MNFCSEKVSKDTVTKTLLINSVFRKERLINLSRFGSEKNRWFSVQTQLKTDLHVVLYRKPHLNTPTVQSFKS